MIIGIISCRNLVLREKLQATKQKCVVLVEISQARLFI